MNNIETICVHGGTEEINDPHSINTPIYPSSANKFLNNDPIKYPRYFNTRNQLVINEKIALLEGGDQAMTFSSGMAAISTTFFALLKPGDHIILPKHIYGGTYHFIQNELIPMGILCDFIEDISVESYREKINPNTKFLYVETPSNPTLEICDLARISKLAKERGVQTICDNTFASPIVQRPIKLGIDIVLHSGTKYLSGHSDIMFGVVVATEKVVKSIWEKAINFGGNLNALDCYIIERSLKTLHLRVRTQNENAIIIAKFLSNHEFIKDVYYPGLESHPNYALASEQMDGYGAIVSFEPKLGGNDFMKELKIIQPALSLGGVESTICSPAFTSHMKMPKTERERIGVTDNLMRLSVGIESVKDLIDDLEKVMNKLSSAITNEQILAN